MILAFLCSALVIERAPFLEQFKVHVILKDMWQGSWSLSFSLLGSASSEVSIARLLVL